MKISSAQGKKLFFSLIITLLIIATAGLLSWGTESIISYYKDKELKKDQKTIELYEGKIKVLNEEGTKMIDQIKVLDYQLDSLKKVKAIIHTKYEEKVNVIYDATAAEHAEWMDSILTELSYSKGWMK